MTVKSHTAEIECYQEWTRVTLHLSIEDIVKLGTLLSKAPEVAARGHVDWLKFEINRTLDDGIAYSGHRDHLDRSIVITPIGAS